MPSPSSSYWNTVSEHRDYPETYNDRGALPPPPPYSLPATTASSSGATPAGPSTTRTDSPPLKRSNSTNSSSSSASASTLISPGDLGADDLLGWILQPELSLYDVLGVSRNATEADIRRAYLRRSKDCHPDRLVTGRSSKSSHAGDHHFESHIHPDRRSSASLATTESPSNGSPFVSNPRRNSTSSQNSYDTLGSEGSSRAGCSDQERTDQATAAFQRLAFAYETLRDDGMRRRYDLFGDEAFASADFDDDGSFESWWWGDWSAKKDSTSDQSGAFAEEVFGGAVRQLYEEFFASSFDQIMAAIDIVQRLNPQVEFSREKLTEFLLHLRDLASLDASKVSSLFASVHPEVMKLSDLRDEWCRLSWWDIGSQLRVGVDMGRTLVKIYGRVVAEARMRGVNVEDGTLTPTTDTTPSTSPGNSPNPIPAMLPECQPVLTPMGLPRMETPVPVAYETQGVAMISVEVL